MFLIYSNQGSLSFKYIDMSCSTLFRAEITKISVYIAIRLSVDDLAWFGSFPYDGVGLSYVLVLRVHC